MEILTFSLLELFSFVDDPTHLGPDGRITRQAYFGREFTHRQKSDSLDSRPPFHDAEIIHIGKVLNSAIVEWKQTPEQLFEELMLSGDGVNRRRHADALCAG